MGNRNCSSCGQQPNKNEVVLEGEATPRNGLRTTDTTFSYGDVAQVPLGGICSPSSFRVQVEGLASEYESLHATGQALLEENRRLRAGVIPGEKNATRDVQSAGPGAKFVSSSSWDIPKTPDYANAKTSVRVTVGESASDSRGGMRRQQSPPIVRQQSNPMLRQQSPPIVRQQSSPILRQQSASILRQQSPRDEKRPSLSFDPRASLDLFVADHSTEPETLSQADNLVVRQSSVKIVDSPMHIPSKLSVLPADLKRDDDLFSRMTSPDDIIQARGSLVSDVHEGDSGMQAKQRGSAVHSMLSGISGMSALSDPAAAVGYGGTAGSHSSICSQKGGGLFPRWFDPGNIKSDAERSVPMEIPVSSVEANISQPWRPRATLEQEEVGEHCTISPIGKFRLFWDFCSLLLLLCELWITPFELIFLEHSPVPTAFFVLFVLISGFFSLDIILNFFTGFVEGDKIVGCRQRIFRNYIRFWFWVDLAATLPFEVILNAASGGALSAARIGKAGKVVKTLRYMRLLRLARLVKISQQASKVTVHFQFFSSVGHLLIPLQCLIFLAMFAHVHGCIWAFLQPKWRSVDNPNAALLLYVQSFWWAYTAVTVGSVGFVGDREAKTQSWGIFLLEMIIASERLLLCAFISSKVLLRALSCIDEARMLNARTDVLTYLRKNKVSFQTRIQVLFCLRDTSNATRQQRFFNALTQERLPRELQRTICVELWSCKLMTLGLIEEIAEWHSDFIIELSQLVTEEVHPSKVILFKVGEAAIAAYYIIDGVLSVDHAPGGIKVPNFKIGMWVGENALVSSLLRRSATFQTLRVTSVMAVRGDSFQETLSRLGLMEQFQTFCGEQLWRGLCGRCGRLGDHFSDSCNLTKKTLFQPNTVGKPSIPFVTTSAMPKANSGFWGTASKSAGSTFFGSKNMGTGSREMSSTNSSMANSHNSDFKRRIMSRELQRFLAEVDLAWAGELLMELDIFDLSDLETLELTAFQAALGAHQKLTDLQERAFSPEGIRRFRERQASSVHRTLFHQVSRLQHLMFLSHYKLEAGTEAALLRTEIEHAIARDPGSLGHHFEQPVFLDSDDLSNLEDLQQRVCNTHNLVLLLTKGVLTRPWVLLEILTAWREGVRTQPVMITKPGSEFEFPDEAFYTQLRAGSLFDASAMECITSHGFSVEQLELAMRNVFQQIAVPYSPHKATNIRQAEVDKLMRNCKLKRDPGGSEKNCARAQSLSPIRSMSSSSAKSQEGIYRSSFNMIKSLPLVGVRKDRSYHTHHEG